VLALAPPGALRIDVGKRPGRPHSQDEINAVLVEHGQAGRTVVRLKGGDPFVFGRGGEEAMALAQAGVAYEVVPGVSAAFAVPAYGGVPVTHRGLASSVTVVTGTVGDLASAGADWEALGRAGGTLVVLMGIEHRADIAARLMAAGRSARTPVLAVHWGTTAAQRSVRTDLERLGRLELDPPVTLVIGEVAGLELDWFTPGPLAGRRVVVTRQAGRDSELVAALEEAGAVVHQLPVLSSAPPADRGAALDAALSVRGWFDWVLCTSALAVEQVMGRLGDGRDLAGTSLGAVGPATAAAWLAHGLVADVVADPATAEGLANVMPDAPAGGGRALYPRAEKAGPALAEALGAKGWAVEEVVAYRTVAVGPDDLAPGAIDAARGADIVVFLSPSAVAAYLSLPDRGPVPPVVVCIGPVTAEAARGAGLLGVIESAEPTVSALVTSAAGALDAPGAPGAPGAPS